MPVRSDGRAVTLSWKAQGLMSVRCLQLNCAWLFESCGLHIRLESHLKVTAYEEGECVFTGLTSWLMNHRVDLN